MHFTFEVTRFDTVRVLATATTLAGLTLAAAAATRIGLADYYARQQTLRGTEQALRWAPDQASYWSRLALLLSDEDPSREMQALNRAVALNPGDARAWIERGLRFEVQGDQTMAEQSLLRAAAEDTQYLPAWSLANYYFRRKNAAQFWFWIRKAVAMSYGDPAPLFQLCWSFTSDGREIENQLGILSPHRQAGYLNYLLAQNRLDDAVSAAKRLTGNQPEQPTPLLLETCERLLKGGRPEQAMEIWNLLAGSRGFPYGRLAPEAGLSLTNATFSIPPVSLGFDWHLPVVQGVSTAREDPANGLRVSLSGEQPERCEIAMEILPVLEQGRYRLKYCYLTSALPAGSGLAWRVFAPGEISSLSAPESLSSENEREGELSFVVPARCHFVRLSLGYQRTPGTTRIEGSVTFRKLNLTRLIPRG